MSTTFESVRSNALPRDLALRMAIARAIDALVLYPVVQELSDDQTQWFKRAADLLRPTSDQPLKTGGSLADYRNDIGLVRAAKSVWNYPEAAALAKELAAVADDLERLWRREVLPAPRIAELKEILRAFRNAIEPSTPIISERIEKTQG